MNNILHQFREAKLGNQESMTCIINRFNPKIKSALRKTRPIYKEDLTQELYISIIKVIKTYEIDNVPGFWEFKNVFDEKTKKNASN